MTELKPCPFCGGKAKVKKAPWDRSEEGSSVCEVYCTKCHASIYGETFNFYQVKYDSDNPQDQISAIEKWNRRKERSDKEKLSWLGKNCKDCGNEKCKRLGTLPQGYDCALWQAESEG